MDQYARLKESFRRYIAAEAEYQQTLAKIVAWRENKPRRPHVVEDYGQADEYAAQLAHWEKTLQEYENEMRALRNTMAQIEKDCTAKMVPLIWYHIDDCFIGAYYDERNEQYHLELRKASDYLGQLFHRTRYYPTSND